MNLLQNNYVLIGLVALLALIALLFAFWVPPYIYGSKYSENRCKYRILDLIISQEVAKNILEEMSDDEKNAHFLVTLILDSLFICVYSSLFIGIILKFFEPFSTWLIPLTILVVVLDLSENIIHLNTLKSNKKLSSQKSLVTLSKFTLFIGELIILTILFISKIK